MADDEFDVYSEDEGLQLLLGGLAVSAMSPNSWREEEDSKQLPSIYGADVRVRNNASGTHQEREITRNIRLLNMENLPEEVTYGCYDRAFHSTTNGHLIRPPVRIVDMSSTNNRGNGLVATRQIRKGEVIFTERAAVVTQLLPMCIVCQNTKETRAWSSLSIRACQNCFRSLEPISTLSSPGIALPLPQLWTVPEYHDGSERHGYRVDAHGRVQCTECNALFCSQQCKDTHGNEMGSCCHCSSAVNAVVHALHSPHILSGDGSTDQDNLELQPAVITAVRMYCSLLSRYRSVGELGLGHYEGMCGDADDVTPLELGCEEVVDASNTETRYTLRSAYDAMCNALDITMEDRQVLSLEFFHRLAAISARNGFAVTPQSPFRAYHAALLRAAGGRGTDCHNEIMKQVAMTLGSKDGALRRDMDRQVEEKCSVQVVALFSLTARINHSCDPCAEVRNQEFVDCHIDLVAKRDILNGEEITISYINVGRMAGKVATDRKRRMRELQAKYLFTCDCVRCRNIL